MFWAIAVKPLCRGENSHEQKSAAFSLHAHILSSSKNLFSLLYNPYTKSMIKLLIFVVDVKSDLVCLHVLVITLKLI